MPSDEPEKQTAFQRFKSALNSGPLSYLEFREADYVLTRERKEALNIAAAKIRDLCRPELDDYVNCCAAQSFILFSCRKENHFMRRCIKKYQDEVATPEAIQELMRQRLQDGTSLGVPSYVKARK